MKSNQLLGDGVVRSSGRQAMRYNLLAARLVAELVKGMLGPGGMDKMFVDLLGEATLTKDGATLLRKIDVEHPAAKVIIEAANAVDNEVGDGTTSVVVLAGGLVEGAEALLDMGIAPTTIADGYAMGLEIALEELDRISMKCDNTDKPVMKRLVRTCLQSKPMSFAGDHVEQLIVDAVCSVTDFASGRAEIDDIKIEGKPGSILDDQLVDGIVLNKTIDSSSMPKSVANARILLIDDDLEGQRTKTDAEIRITSPYQLDAYSEAQSGMIRSKLKHIVDSGANVVISRKGINTFAQNYLKEKGIISVRRAKENDLIWLARATGAAIVNRLDHEHHEHEQHDHVHDHDHEGHHHHNSNFYHHGDVDFRLGYAERVSERFLGDDRVVFVEGCRNPKAVTLLLRANSKGTLDECHRSALDGICVLRDFIASPLVIAGGGATEAAIARNIRARALTISGREQLVLEKFADALEEIPITIARNAGMDEIDSLVQLRSMQAVNGEKGIFCGVDAITRRIKETFPEIIEPVAVKKQVLKTGVEVTNMLLRIDDVLMAKPAMYSHTHGDGTTHSHAGGAKRHDHFDELGKKQRPMHHYY